MSGIAGPAGDDLVVRAGEYVLGLADADERRAAEEAGGDTGLRAAIADWERRLLPLYAAIRPAHPPPALWTRLERSAFGAAEPSRQAPIRASGPGRAPRRTFSPWGAGAAGFLIAAALAGIALLQRPPVPPPIAVAALLPKAAGGPIVVAELLPSGALRLQAVGALAVPPGHDDELWSLPAGATRPVALGILRPAGTVLTPDQVPSGPGQILVSLEPRGGSPTGLPTGPVLSGGPYRGHT